MGANQTYDAAQHRGFNLVSRPPLTAQTGHWARKLDAATAARYAVVRCKREPRVWSNSHIADEVAVRREGLNVRFAETFNLTLDVQFS